MGTKYHSSYSAIKKEALRLIVPSKKEEENAKKVSQEVKNMLQNRVSNARITVGGSLAKGTWLKNNHDIDFFACFSTMPANPLVELETIGAERVKGSRAYYQFTYKNFSIEVVPVLAITSHTDAQNVTDMSVLHVEHVRKHMMPRQQNEVRLAKQFCKAQNVYGAESYIKGFSGHVLELLIMHYGSFKKLLEAASRWSNKTVLDPMNHHVNPQQVINKSKQQSPLMIIDPVQPLRNASAALSKKSYETFIQAAKTFLKKPTIQSFKKKPLTIQHIQKKPGNKVIIELFSLNEKRDTAGTKCLKAFEYVASHIEPFTLLDSGFEYDHERGSAMAYLIVGQDKLSKEYTHYGPPLHATRGVQDFKKKYAKTFDKNGMICTTLTRKHTTINEKVRALLQDEPVTKRTKNCYTRI